MSKKLAIRGHSTRGKEVIELLEMMGGKNIHNLYGNNSFEYYVSGHAILNDRLSIIEDDDFVIFNLEEFLEKYPYKVGDTVTVWVEDWENRRGSYVSVKIECVKWDDCRCEIIYVTKVGGMYIFFEAKDVKENMEEKDKAKAPVLKGEDYSGKRYGYKIPDGYEFDVRKIGYTLNELIDLVPLTSDSVMIAVREGFEIIEEQGKFFLKKKKPKYPTTYEECCKVLCKSPEFLIKYSVDGNDTEGDAPLIKKFIKLKRCRDAYWKIAGEEMGLDGPWKANFTQGSGIKYTILFANGEVIWNRPECETVTGSRVLAFPTPEMRDAFYENFKDLIEECKELL